MIVILGIHQNALSLDGGITCHTLCVWSLPAMSVPTQSPTSMIFAMPEIVNDMT